MDSISLLADENMPALEGLPSDVCLLRMPGRSINSDALNSVSALLVRSVTQVDEALLAGTRVNFVGSATIGTDHIDQAYLQRQNITFAHAPGCNAMAVAEYVLQVVLRWSLDQQRPMDKVSVGIVGAGNVGARVGWLLDALGCVIHFSDPPREQAGESPPMGSWATLDQVLSCDVVSLHVPLVGREQQSDWATYHLIDHNRLAPLSSRQLLVNTCRGAVIDNMALLERLEQGNAPTVALDVWEGEPWVNADLCDAVWLATPHIAGYSLQGKQRGTAMVLSALGEWAGWQEQGWQAPVEGIHESVWSGAIETNEQILALLQSRYNVFDDDQRLRAVVKSDQPALGFDQLRKHYPVRHELAGLRVEGKISDHFKPLMNCLGIGSAGLAASSDPAAQWLRESCSR